LHTNCCKPQFDAGEDANSVSYLPVIFKLRNHILSNCSWTLWKITGKK